MNIIYTSKNISGVNLSAPPTSGSEEEAKPQPQQGGVTAHFTLTCHPLNL